MALVVLLALGAVTLSSASFCSTQDFHDGVNCYGNDIKYFTDVKEADDCCALCLNTTGCKAWTLNKDSNHRCYVKTSCSSPSSGDAISGYTPPPPSPPPPFYPFRNASLPWEQRLENLLSLLTIDEKVGFLSTAPPGVPRLGISPYSFELECDSGVCGGSGGSVFYNACLGVCNVDNVTSFPQSSGMACTWNTSLIQREGDVIGREVRAISANKFGMVGQTLRLSCFSPMINIIRNPLWCRNSEGYSEDPVLTGELAAAMVRGMQGNHPRYLQVVAGCKHFVPYDGIAADHSSDYDLFATYMVAFERCLEESVQNLMCSYTKPNYAGTDSCTNPRILTTMLREHFNWTGFVISDLGAVDAHAPTSLAAGMDVYLGGSPNSSTVQKWIHDGDLTAARLDEAISRSIMPRFLEGEFDPRHMVPYWNTSIFSCDSLGSSEHRQVAHDAAVQSIVLVKNDGILPLPSSRKVAVLGPFGNVARWMFNRYSHVPPEGSGLLVSLFDALRQLMPGTTGAAGCLDAKDTTECKQLDSRGISEALKNADTIVITVGNGEPLESETTCEDVHDNLNLCKGQQALMDTALAAGKKVIAIVFTTAPKNGTWLDKADAVLVAHYPQSFGGIALAEILVGKEQPSGKLAATWPKQLTVTPVPGRLYARNVTYRYGGEEALYPFGYGLSYTSWAYSEASARPVESICDGLTVDVTVKNAGSHAASEVVQAYVQITPMDPAQPVTKYQLAAFSKVLVPASESRKVSLFIPARNYAILTKASTNSSTFLDQAVGDLPKPQFPEWKLEPTKLTVFVGGQQPHQEVTAPSNVLEINVQLPGPVTPLDSC